MKHLSRRVRLALVAAVVGGGALAIPATAAHATVNHSTAASSPSSIISVCLTIQEINFKQCVVI